MSISLPIDTPKGQREAITANDKVITVEAGAGTGKTWVLSQRYLNLLLGDKDLLPSDILTLTFTEAAAGEMKERIEKLISESLHLFPDNERRQTILDGLSDSWISTIHSFSARLIHESGLSLDIDPSASVISAYQEQSFWEDIRKAAEFAGFGKLARNTGGEILKAAESLDKDEYMNAAAGKWNAGNLASLARNTAELHASSGLSWPDMMKWADDDSDILSDARDKVMELLRDEWRGVWNRWHKMNLPAANNPNGPGGQLNNLMSWLHTHNPDDESLRHFYMCIVLNILGIRTPGGRPSEPFRTVREELGMTLGKWREMQPGIIKSLTEDTGPSSTEQEKAMRKTLLKFCAVSWALWDNMKSKRGLLSFSDMILHAKRTIERKGIRKTFRHILVDEFQDTDTLQFDMIEALRNYREDSSLFAVGDPKQSIYKFRHADPALFADIIRQKDTRRINLDASFRTRAPLLARINAMFKNLWPEGISRQKSMKSVKYNALSPANHDAARESGTMPDFRVYLLRKDSSSDECRKILASHLAAEISSWVSEGRTVWDKKDSVIRPVKYSDFAILSRGRGCFSVLEEALQRYGIPSVQDRSTEYFSRGEIGDVVCTLRASANFDDDFSVMGWLMSPFSGVAENDAITKCLILSDDKHKPIDLVRENLPEAYSKLEYLSVVGENEGASGILSYYDRKRDWLSCYPEKDRLRVLRNVRLALKIARELQSSGESSLVSCAEYMTRSIRNKSSYEEPAWHDESENAVRLGAVHSAKGLEYPVTVVFEDRTRKNSDRGSLMPSRELGLSVSKLPDETFPPGGLKSKLPEWHKLLSEQGDTEEEERLFYVACTRAQDSLIFFGLIKKDDGNNGIEGYAGTWSDFMLKSIDGMRDVTPKIISEGGNLSAPCENIEAESKSPITAETVRAVKSLRQISATSFALYEWCPHAWRRQYSQGRTLEWEYSDRENNDDIIGGAEFGSLAHWILARWPKSDDLESELDRYLHDKDTLALLPGHVRDAWRRNDKDSNSRLKEWLMDFSASPLGITLRNNPNVKREQRFRIPLSSDTVMSGAVDAFYGNTVVDYKITAVDDAPAGLYDSQLDFYAYVVYEKSRGNHTHFDSINSKTVFLRENRTLERTITDFASIRERIESAAEKCASGHEESYAANHKNCGCCPFKKGCGKYAGTIHE